jgi:hypothetical protein
MRLLVVLPLLLLTACASGGDQLGAPPPPASDGADDQIRQADNDLVVEVDPGDGSPPRTYTLSCVGVVEGDHPDAEEACAHLKSLDDPFAPIPDDVVCTELYGGPQTARVRGLWRGEPVDLELSRVDGCRISQWDSLGPLLPGEVGVEPPGGDAPQ